MSNQLGPLEISCDAPPYVIVQACQLLQFKAPLDVRWCEKSHYLREGPAGVRLWNLFAKSQPVKTTCTCGMPLPLLENYAFTFACGKVLHYNLSQCSKCRTMFWEEGFPSDADGRNRQQRNG